MSGSRIDTLRVMVAAAPGDPRPRLFLAHELFRAGDWEGAAAHYRAYVEMGPGDEGAAWRSLGLCLERLGREPEALDAYRRGIASAQANGHATLAGEIRFLMDDLEG